MNIKKQLGAKIKRLRTKHELTQEQLAEKIGIATRTVCGIENGENFVKAETLEKLCETFGITCFELFASDHIKPRNELLEEIISDINEFDEKGLETVYKLVKILKLD